MPRTAPGFARTVAAVVLLALAGPADGRADWLPSTTRNKLRTLSSQIGGQVLDYTNNHGSDRRLYCPALGEYRAVYVYLPPGYDGTTQFPAMLWLHGIAADERPFLDLVPIFDEAIRSGLLPPMIVVGPDGSVRGRPALLNRGSFYLNGLRGNFEDYVIHDVWAFATRTLAIRPERDARLIGGGSMGGFGAYNLGFKHREKFGQLVGIMPPLNLRYGDCHGRYMTPYDPNCFELRRTDRRHEIVGRFYGVLLIRSRQLLDPVIGRRHPDPTGFIAAQNPYEMLAAYDIRPDEFGMFIGYGKKDEFNIAAQVESFVDAARARGIRPAVVVVPDGRHNLETALKMFPAFGRWAWERVGAYVPAGYCPTAARVVPLCTHRYVPLLPASPLTPGVDTTPR